MVCPKIASLDVVELGLGHRHSDFFPLDSGCVTWDQKKCYFLRSLNWPPGTWTNRTFYSWDQVTYVKQIQPETPWSVISCSHPLPIFLGLRQIFLKVLFKTWNILTKKKKKNILTNYEWVSLPLENHILNKQDVFKRLLITLSSCLTTAAIPSFSSSRCELSWVWSVSFQTFRYVLTSTETVVFGVIHRVVGSWVVFWFGCFTQCGEHTGSSFLVDTGTRFSGGDNEIQNCSSLGYGPILLPKYSAKWF